MIAHVDSTRAWSPLNVLPPSLSLQNHTKTVKQSAEGRLLKSKSHLL